jgi:hypothetical protein
MLQNLSEAIPLLRAEDDLVLGLPVNAVLTQRFHLPTVDPAEFREMVRIQIEKALPFSPDEVTTDFEVIEQNESGCVVSAIAVRNEELSKLAAPLLESGYIPTQVTVYASQRATTHAPQGRALLIYPEGEQLVSAVTENGKVSLTRTLDGIEPHQLQSELPQLTLSAELQGIGAFPNVFLDESCYELRDTVQDILTSRPELVGIETPPASVKLNLLPASWKERRAQLARRGEWRNRLVWAGAIYAGLFVLALLYLGYMRFQVGRLDRVIGEDAPKIEFVRNAEANWKSLAPALDTRYYPVEILLHVYESLPSTSDVRITTYNQSARQLSVDGEANTAALAYQFADKVKKNPQLQVFQFTMADPRILANGHAQFRLEGHPR